MDATGLREFRGKSAGPAGPERETEGLTGQVSPVGSFAWKGAYRRGLHAASAPAGSMASLPSKTAWTLPSLPITKVTRLA